MIPVLTAVIAALAVLSGAWVTRAATRYSARLQASQRKRDAELATLDEFGNALLEAATAVQSYTFRVDETTRRELSIPTEKWEEILPVLEPALISVQRLELLIPMLPWDDVAKSAQSAKELLMEVVAQSNDPNVDAWSKAMANQPDVITNAVATVSKRRRALLDTYPVHAPRRISTR